MKKLLLFVLLGSSLQDSAQLKEWGKGSYFTLNNSYNIPMVCYASHDLANPNAAFAKAEMGLDVNYGYQLADQFGIVVTLGFGSNKVDKTYITSPSEKGYRYFTVYAGPQYVKRISNNFYLDLRILGGLARVHSPTLINNDELLLSEAKASSFTWGTGVGLKYLFSSSTFLSLRLDHLNMKPAFNVPGDKKNEQHIVVISPGLGLGVKF